MLNFGEPEYLAEKLIGIISFWRTRLRGISMGLTSKEIGKAVMTRSVADITFSTNMVVLDFEPSREEKTFLQLIGLYRFITRVTWEIMNASVIQEVLTNLDVETMETMLNEHTISIFDKRWR